ncbi:MAG TPA: UvrD-helicase domain-containing protein [Bryobacteraceae bacterium]|nr:UvrD-helicase domain-containing protein [Bryobacteraceae bacterium]
MIADKTARERALDTATSFIVQAPAGSGKTELLIQRYLKLLEIVDAPDSVIAITFTRKAAGEMRSRALDALRNAQTGVEPEAEHERVTCEIARRVLEHDRRLGWNLLRNPAQMRIETIDSLCVAITRRMPWLSRFGGMPEFSEKAGDLYREAARNTLMRVESGDEALSYLLLHLDNNFQEAGKLIANMLEKRDQWLRHTGANPDLAAVRAALEETLERRILSELQRLRAGFPPEVASEIVLLRRLETFPEARLADLPQWNTIAELLLTGHNDWRIKVNKTVGFPPNDPLKSRCEQLLARLQSENALLESLKRFRKLPAARYSDTQWQALQAAVSVLILAVGELQMVFRERGRVDFAELAIRASEALGHVDTPTDLALTLGHRIQHILVDEFQDTSFTQFELLRKLTAGWEPGDGRTLFLVGDPMQSIYRFRQADVGLFLKARLEGIGSIRLEALSLSVNFRSRRGFVEWVNLTFEKLLPATDDIEAGAVAFSPSTAREDEEHKEGEEYVGIHAFTEAPDEAQRVVELVQASGDAKVAVLVRARTHLVAIVDAMKRHKVPYQAIEIDQLGERPVIEDLMALTLALLHPGDRVSWLAILRAPWCGLTLQDLHTLAGADHYAAVWDLLHRPDIVLSDDGAARVERILPALEEAIAQRGRRPLRDWIEGVWLRLGGPACVADETALEDASAYFDLLEGIAEGADLADFGWFREQVNALFAQPDAQAGDRVQVMTIFKAKGLEFDTVILPGLRAVPRQDEPQLVMWLEQDGELLLAPKPESGKGRDPIFDYLSRVERFKAESETARLLYVAATRTRSKLHLLGTIKTKEDGSVAEPAPGSFLKLLWPVMGHAFATVSSASSVREQEKTRTIRRVPPDWVVAAAPLAVTWTRRHVEAVETQPLTYEWVGDRLRHAGTAIHTFLQRIAHEGLDRWDEAAVRVQRSACRAVLANLGVPPVDLDETATLVETGLLRTLHDPRGRWILERHSDDASELAITGMIDGRLYEAVIDRTFVDEGGVRWIIDFKTGTHSGSDLETFLESERKRHEEQLGRYARLMMQRDDRPIRLALYFPLLGAWLEWAAPVVLRKQGTLFEL